MVAVIVIHLFTTMMSPRRILRSQRSTSHNNRMPQAPKGTFALIAKVSGVTLSKALRQIILCALSAVVRANVGMRKPLAETTVAVSTRKAALNESDKVSDMRGCDGALCGVCLHGLREQGARRPISGTRSLRIGQHRQPKIAALRNVSVNIYRFSL